MVGYRELIADELADKFEKGEMIARCAHNDHMFKNHEKWFLYDECCYDVPEGFWNYKNLSDTLCPEHVKLFRLEIAKNRSQNHD